MTGHIDIKERGKKIIDRTGKNKKKKGLGSSVHLRQVAPFSVAEPHLVPTIEELFQQLETKHNGLGAYAVSKRQEIYGPNELRVRTDVPIYLRFLRQFKNFFAILLIVGGLLAVLAEQLDPGSGSLYIAYGKLM